MGRKTNIIGTAILTALAAPSAHAFSPGVALQAFIKSGTTPYTSSGVTVRVLVQKGGTNVWCKDLPSTAINAGVLSVILSGSSSACASETGAPYTGSLDSLLINSSSSDVFTATVKVDTDGNGIGVGSDASFTGIALNAVPFATVASNLTPNGATDGQLLKYNNTTKVWEPYTLVVHTADLASGAVDSASIGAGEIGTTNLAAGAVTAAKMAASSVDLSTSTVTGALPLANVAAGSATSNQYLKYNGSNWAPASLSVSGSDLGAGSVGTTNIAANAVTAAKMAVSAVDLSTTVVTGALPLANVAAGSATSGQHLIYNGSNWAPTTLSVAAADIASGAITTAKFAAGAVDSAALGSGVVTTAKFAAGAVDTAALGATSVTAAKMAASSVDLSGTTVTNNLPLGKGGTNAAITAVDGGIIYSSSTAMGVSAAGTAGQVLSSNGTGAPVWGDFGTSVKTKLNIWEDFISTINVAASTSAMVGNNMMASLPALATLTPQTGTAGNIGVTRLATGTTASATMALGLCGASAGGTLVYPHWIVAGDYFDFQTRLQIPTAIAANNGITRIGLSNTLSLTAGGPIGAYFEVNVNTATATTNAKGTAAMTPVATGTVVNNGFHIFRILYNASGISFYLDGTQVGTTTNTSTNFPTGNALCAGVLHMQSATGVTKNIDVDYMGFIQTVTPAR